MNIENWMKLVTVSTDQSVDDCAKDSVIKSYSNLMTFPWIKEAVEKGELMIHLWFFDIEEGEIQSYRHSLKKFVKGLE